MQVRDEGGLDQDRADGDGVYRTIQWSKVERNRRHESRTTLGILIKQSVIDVQRGERRLERGNQEFYLECIKFAMPNGNLLNV